MSDVVCRSLQCTNRLNYGFSHDLDDLALAVRKQLESFIAHDLGRSGNNLGRYITEQAILYISDNMLSDMYWKHVLGEL